MDRRLPPREGEWIDRNRTVSFRFEGNAYHGYAGDVLSSALWANDVRMMGRSFKYHRPRGIMSLAGHDCNVLVEDGRRTNMRGDLLPIEPGLDVRAVNTVGGLAGDRLRITEYFSRLLPVGFYYKAFHTPRWLFPFYERQMRQVAGLGKINPVAEPTASPKDYAFCDLLVVGAGPSGMAAALAAAEQGVDVLVVDQAARPGGSLLWQWTACPQAQQQLHELISRVQTQKNIRIRCATLAGGWYADHWIGLFDNQRLTKLRAEALLVASGCIEQPAVFQNNDLPGVMLGSAAQRLIHLYAVKPLDRAVVLAANSMAYQVALDLIGAGADVEAVVDLRHEGEPTDVARQVLHAGIPVHKGHVVYEAVPAPGKQRIRGAVVCPLDAQGNVQTDKPLQLDCDGIIQSVGWAPNGDLAYQAGVRFGYSEQVHQFVPRSLPESVFVAGRANGIFRLEAQIDDGRRAGLKAAKHLGHYHDDVPDTPIHDESPPSHREPFFAHDGKKNFVDLDEDLHLADFSNAHQEGYDNIELVKRYTTVGMGPSQGKLSNTAAVRILAGLNHATIDQTGTTTSRPFHQPVPIGHLAGRRFHPVRRTPMHDWHVATGAEMIHAGAWMRPEYYRVDGPNRDKDKTILEEARSVRRDVGLIDVGTLGKLYVSGPHAVRFLELLYTGRFAKQKIGTMRYGMACDEMGIIIEDGVVARLAEDRFYVTATSSGAATFYREMQRWALIFGLDVSFVNATGQLAAMNIAGPSSREVLQPLTDVELSADAFPYLGVREGRVAGVPAFLMRVGFVGELGFEVHVPGSHGHHVWKSLTQAGQRCGIRPFGVEAQRLLRLEKGHLIVGQDTDALTNPFEANVAWAIGKNKSFFIGSRALETAQKKELSRLLVGIVFNPKTTGPLPEECHLIFDGREMAGRVTSMGPSSTLGYPLALAFVRPDLAEIGTRVQVRVGDGSQVEAEVTGLPFYDPDNERQKM